MNKLDKISKSMWMERAKWRMDNKEDLRFSFGIAVQTLRLMREKGLTKEQLAQDLNVNIEDLTNFLRGNDLPDFEMITAVFKYFTETKI